MPGILPTQFHGYLDWTYFADKTCPHGVSVLDPERCDGCRAQFKDDPDHQCHHGVYIFDGCADCNREIAEMNLDLEADA